LIVGYNVVLAKLGGWKLKT